MAVLLITQDTSNIFCSKSIRVKFACATVLASTPHKSGAHSARLGKNCGCRLRASYLGVDEGWGRVKAGAKVVTCVSLLSSLVPGGTEHASEILFKNGWWARATKRSADALKSAIGAKGSGSLWCVRPCWALRTMVPAQYTVAGRFDGGLCLMLCVR